MSIFIFCQTTVLNFNHNIIGQLPVNATQSFFLILVIITTNILLIVGLGLPSILLIHLYDAYINYSLKIDKLTTINININIIFKIL